MARNEDGELELVLGNKQLLSVFFIVVVLLGVFFTMGYIAGRNSSEEARMASAPGQPLIVEPEPSAASTRAKPPAPEPAASPASKPVSTPASVSKPAVVKPKPAPKPIPPAAAPRQQAAPATSGPAPGQVFLQVAATSRAEGKVLLDVLAKRGFKGQLAPVPNQDLFRVLVGPVHGSQELAKTRTALREAGFKPFTRKY